MYGKFNEASTSTPKPSYGGTDLRTKMIKVYKVHFFLVLSFLYLDSVYAYV